MWIPGNKLNNHQRKQVLAAFVNRNTKDHPNPSCGLEPYETDDEYLARLAFCFVRDGSRLNRITQHAIPHYMA